MGRKEAGKNDLKGCILVLLYYFKDKDDKCGIVLLVGQTL